VSSPPDAEPRCTACLNPVAPEDAKCANCGLQHPTRVLARGGLWVVALVLCGVWAIAFLVVAGAR
jgi:hypothetical protein